MPLYWHKLVFFINVWVCGSVCLVSDMLGHDVSLILSSHPNKFGLVHVSTILDTCDIKVDSCSSWPFSKKSTNMVYTPPAIKPL